MLKEARIFCFQSHEATVLKFGSGINIIVGEGNDIGKTALFRAIEWPITNRPLGDGFISNFQDGSAKVELITEDANVIRTKGPKENKYILTAGEFNEEVFKAFGSNPPEPVRDALNFLDVNIQKQLSLPFLVLDSPGQIAQHIRDIANLDDIDKVINLLKSKARTVIDQLAIHNKSLEKTDQELTEISKINIKHFETLLKQTEETKLDAQDISFFIESLSSLTVNLREMENNWIHLPKDVDQIIKDVSTLLVNNKSQAIQIDNLEKLITNLREMENNWIYLPKDVDEIVEDVSTLLVNNKSQAIQIDNLEKLITKIKKLEQQKITLPADLDNILIAVEEAKLQYNNKVREITTLNSLIEQLRKIDERMLKIHQEENEKLEQFNILLEQLASCPKCASKLTDKTKQHLLEEYKE
jgi:DNA repair exonuclease SbcCD ATPase subunit